MICQDAIEKRVFPILLRHKGNAYLTLYYDTKRSDAVLHCQGKVLYFQSMAEMQSFCQEKGLEMQNDTVVYDFDAPIQNPIDYKQVLHRWNLLDTIADTLGMYFEGDGDRYTAVYDLLFRAYTSATPIPPTWRLREKDYRYVLRVFRKQDRFFRRFVLFTNQL